VSLATPDIQVFTTALKEKIQTEYSKPDQSMPATLADMITLTQNLASIIAPLAADIHSTFGRFQQTKARPPGVGLNETSPAPGTV
jgi:hypothetical protein